MKFNQLVNFNKIIFCAFAPGGANALKGIIENLESKHKVYILAEGPALKIFESMDNRTLDFINYEDLKSNLEFHNSTLLITGLSGNNDFELKAILLAKKLKLYSISVLEHWSNYEQRVYLQADKLTKKDPVLPDFFWVQDEDALEVFRQTSLPQEKVSLVPSFYLNGQVEQVKKFSDNLKKDETIILFLCEYLDLKYPNPTDDFPVTKEMEIVDHICNTFNKVFKDRKNIKLKLRLHPYENISKYDQIIGKYQKIEKSPSSVSLFLDLAQADVVLGMSSLALVIAVRANKKVYTISKNGNNLPSKSIIYVENIEEIFKEYL